MFFLNVIQVFENFLKIALLYGSNTITTFTTDVAYCGSIINVKNGGIIGISNYMVVVVMIVGSIPGSQIRSLEEVGSIAATTNKLSCGGWNYLYGNVGPKNFFSLWVRFGAAAGNGYSIPEVSAKSFPE